MSPKKKAGKPRKKRPYSVGQVNRLIDDLVHPFYENSQWVRFADGVLHGLVEQNPKVSIEKFVKYNMPRILKKILRKL
jgi:hypothetical protein